MADNTLAENRMSATVLASATPTTNNATSCNANNNGVSLGGNVSNNSSAKPNPKTINNTVNTSDSKALTSGPESTNGVSIDNNKTTSRTTSGTVDKRNNDNAGGLKSNHINNNNNGVHENNNFTANNHSSKKDNKHSNSSSMNGSDTVDKAMVFIADLTTDVESVGDGVESKSKTADEDKKTTIISGTGASKSNGVNTEGSPATLPVENNLSRSNSRTSCNSLNGHNNNNDDSNALLSLEGSTGTTDSPLNTNTTTGSQNGNSDTLKKKLRLSSGRQQTKKAKRVRFYRNGDKFYPGLVLPVSYERYRSFESLTEDLTRVLGETIKVPGAVRTIYTVDGKKVISLDDLEDNKCYVCSCNNEVFKRLDYSSQNNKLNNRLSRVFRPSSPHKNGLSTVGAMPSPTVNLSERDNVVFPRIVTLIRNGVKPRRICRLLLNKRNSPSYEHVLTAITQRVNLDTGCVRKVFGLDGIPVLSLSDFFQHDVDVFFSYGNERVGPDDFELDAEETRQINQLHKTLKTGKLPSGLKPKMPVKSHNETFECVDENFLMIGLQGNDSLPADIKNRYSIGRIIGDGNFAVVLKLTEKTTNQDYALKIIDKSKCLGKEHYIDAEIRIMKMLDHPHIISLISDRDTTRHMYLVMELVNGGDLFDAITRVTRFSEMQSRVMIKHLAAAMAYLHNMGIVHRDIKPENLLVELDEHGNVLMLKLADFGLACEVDEPLLAVCGTPTYVAPEILMETGYGLKIDVWAAGIILYILLCGFPPFVSPDNQQEPLFDAILSGVYEFPEPYWNDIGDGVRDLIANMLQSDPELRFSSEDILDHFWVLDEEPTTAVLQYHQ